MPIVISATASIFTYLVLMHLLFENFDEFRNKLRSMIKYFPISVVVDWAFGRDSLRTWVWTMSGPLIGVIVYSFISGS